jgi:hypothetical protein
MRTRTVVRTTVVAAATWGLAVAAPHAAFADHTHVKVTGNGECAVIAENGGEKYVELPGAVFDSNPNVDVAPAEARNHPLHVLVHQGRPAEARPGTIHVLGSADGDAACSGGYVNR